MKKLLFKLRKISKATAIFSIVFIFIIYLLGVWFYQGHFNPGTTFGGVRIGSTSVQAAQDKINKQIKTREVHFNENEQELGYINGETLGFSVDILSQLQTALNEQSALIWPFTFFMGEKLDDIADEESFTLDQSMTNQLVSLLGIDNSQRQRSIDAQVANNGSEFVIVDAVFGDYIDNNLLKQKLIDSLLSNDKTLDMKNTYEQPLYVRDSEDIQDLFAEVEKMQNTKITLVLEDIEITIPKETIASWIYTDESLGAYVDRDLVSQYLYQLNTNYSSLLNYHSFQSTYRGLVDVQPGTYGWYIARDAETDHIVSDIYAGNQVTREPEIAGSGYGLKGDFGGSYVEVDMIYQMMFIYHNYQLVLETPIVTGGPNTSTVPGAYQVWNMETPSVLNGYNPNTDKTYEQPVDYWIAFDDNAQGIHDANWQSTFGGSAYLSSGSLGCVNTPPGVMPTVFNLVYYGMPVIVIN